MNVQYYHRNLKFFTYAPKFTAVCEVPSKINLLAAITASIVQQVFLDIPVGITFVNPKDQYCKATGRTESLAKCRTETFYFSNIKYNEHTIDITLTNTDEDSKVHSIKFEIKNGRDKVYFIDIYPKKWYNNERRKHINDGKWILQRKNWFKR